jgi:ABC-type sugar transport system substrate-binding protein
MALAAFMSGLLFVTTACGGSLQGAASDQETTADGAEAEGSEAGEDAQPAEDVIEVGVDKLEDAPEVPEDLLIGVTFPHFRDPYWIAEAAGVDRRAEELGVDVEITNAGGYGKSAEQIAQIEDFITQGVDALLVGAVDSTAVAPAVNAAWEQGIPVVYTNALAESDIQAGVYTNDCAVGELQAEYIAEQDPDARIAVFTGPEGVSWPAARSDCFKETLAELAPDAEIVTEKFHDMDRAVVLREMDDVLQAFPDIDYVYNNTDLQALGVVDSLRGAGMEPGEVGVTNLTIGREAFQAMEDGWIEMALAERPALQGALAVDMAIRLVNGEEVEAKWEVEHPSFTADNLGEFTGEESEWNWEPEGYQP